MIFYQIFNYLCNASLRCAAHSGGTPSVLRVKRYGLWLHGRRRGCRNPVCVCIHSWKVIRGTDNKDLYRPLRFCIFVTVKNNNNGKRKHNRHTR